MHIRSYHIAVLALCSAALTGCEWGSAGDNTWNDSYAWANFTGTYRFTKAVIPIATTSTDSDSEDSGENSETTSVVNWYNGASNVEMKSATEAGGQLSPVGDQGVQPGSVEMHVSTVTIVDDKAGNLTLGGSQIGTISYSSGVWSFTTSGIPGSGKGVKVSITYKYGMTKGGKSDPGGGGSGKGGEVTPSYIAISYLNVTQQGNKLTMRSDNGQVYTGQITGASMGADGYVAAQMVNLSFEVSHSSGIKIVGNFSGNWSGAQNSTYGTLSDRQIHGTLSNGTTFVGTAAPVTIHVPDVTVSE